MKNIILNIKNISSQISFPRLFTRLKNIQMSYTCPCHDTPAYIADV